MRATEVVHQPEASSDAGLHAGATREPMAATMLAIGHLPGNTAPDTGFVKRTRLCGGEPEILASDQDQPIAIAVDDNAVYWLDYGNGPGNGTVMRRRKLDAPGYPDASSDAPVDASPDAEASLDAGAVDAAAEGAPDAGD